MLSYLACLGGGSNCLSDSSSKLTFFLAGAMFIMLSVWAGMLPVWAGMLSVGSARRYSVLSIRASCGMGLGVSGRSKIALVINPAVIPPATTAGMLCATYFPTFFAPPKTDRPTLAALEGSAAVIARSAAAIARFRLLVGLARSAAAFARSAAAFARFKLLLLTALLARSKPSVIVRPILSPLLSGGGTR